MVVSSYYNNSVYIIYDNERNEEGIVMFKKLPISNIITAIILIIMLISYVRSTLLIIAYILLIIVNIFCAYMIYKNNFKK